MVYTLWNWKVLSHGEGWGVVAMVGLSSFGLIGFVLDFILVKLISNRLWLNIIQAFIVLFFGFWLYQNINFGL